VIFGIIFTAVVVVPVVLLMKKSGALKNMGVFSAIDNWAEEQNRRANGDRR
jgi:hypothetical protein